MNTVHIRFIFFTILLVLCLGGGNRLNADDVIVARPVPDSSVGASPVQKEKRGLLRTLFGVQEKSKSGSDSSGLGKHTRKGDTQRPLRAEVLDDAFEVKPNVIAVSGSPIPERVFKQSRSQSWVDERIAELKDEFKQRSYNLTDPELNLEGFVKEGNRLDHHAGWVVASEKGYWRDQPRICWTLSEVYSRSLQHSYEVKDFTLNPRIQATSIGLANSEFDTEIFGEGSYDHIDEPTGTTLTTGTTGRLIEDRVNAEAGLRKKLATGTELEVFNEIESLRNNSTFLDPNPQSQSSIGLRIIQPLFRGSGVNYNTISLKIAVLDRGIAYEDMVTGIEEHLLQLNRSYWGLYLARSAYALRLDLVQETRAVVRFLEDREEIDAEATASEIVRARAALLERQADLIRSKTAIRTAEERLRAIVNHPDLQMGVAGEVIPTSRPVMTPAPENVSQVVQTALDNRSELNRSLESIRVAGLRRDSAKNDLKPRVNLFTDVGYAGIDQGRDFGGAYDDLDSNGTNVRAGINFSQTLERGFAKSFHERRGIEFEQAVNRARLAANNVILSVLVSYREMVTSYRDVQAKYQALRATREEVRQLNELVDTDAGAENGRSIGSRLQLLLDAIDRKQRAEESYLISIVQYNFSIASLERSKGTFLRIDQPK
ncbi:MAG: TolC family protein [Verrucomicrobiales bacterium]|nr:TolC family protein [Verrucomicrobiales bacterium]